jgi:hypothetical protein
MYRGTKNSRCAVRYVNAACYHTLSYSQKPATLYPKEAAPCHYSDFLVWTAAAATHKCALPHAPFVFECWLDVVQHHGQLVI